MLATADRVVESWQPNCEALRRLDFERRQCERPFPCLRVVPVFDLPRQHQQPCEPVGPLERGPAGTPQILDLRLDVLPGVRLSASAARAAAANSASGKSLRVAEQPVSVHRRVPVIATVERRRQRAWRLGVRVGLHHLPDLVRVFAVYAFECQPGEPSGRGRVDSRAVAPGVGAARGRRLRRPSRTRTARSGSIVSSVSPGPSAVSTFVRLEQVSSCCADACAVAISFVSSSVHGRLGAATSLRRAPGTPHLADRGRLARRAERDQRRFRDLQA